MRTKSRNLSQLSLIRWWPVKGPVSMIDEPREALRVLDREPQADRAAPVVDDRGRVADVELLEQRRHQLDVAVVRVPGEVGGLVGAAEAGVVGGDAAVARRRGPAGSPCARGTTRSARRGRRRPAPLPLVEIGEAQPVDLVVARTRTGSRADPAKASSGVRTTSSRAHRPRSLFGLAKANSPWRSRIPTIPINFLLPCRTTSELSQSTKYFCQERKEHFNAESSQGDPAAQRQDRPPRRASRAGLGALASPAVAAVTTPPRARLELGSGSGGSIDVVGYSTPESVYQEALEPAFEKTSEGSGVSFSNSFGASGDQSRAVAAGQPASVVHFSQAGDMERLVEEGEVVAGLGQAAHTAASPRTRSS